jgi:hypothetical protein
LEAAPELRIAVIQIELVILGPDPFRDLQDRWNFAIGKRGRGWLGGHSQVVGEFKMRAISV